MKIIKLGEICNIKTGKKDANASVKNGKYPFFTCSKEILTINSYSYDCECILVSGNGDLNVKYYNGKFDAYQRTYIIEPQNKEEILPKYLFYLINGKIDYLRKKAIGGVIKYIKLENLKSIDVPIIDINEQKQIINAMEKLEKIVDNRKIQIIKCDELIKSLYKENFDNKDYQKVKVREVCDFITKGTTPPAGMIYDKYEDGMIPYLKVYNLSFNGELLFKQHKQFIPLKIHQKQLFRSKVYPDDVLMNIVGPPLGKFSLVSNEFAEWNINQAIAIFRAKEKILPKFLMYSLMRSEIISSFEKLAVGVRQLNLSLEQCRNLLIPLPSLNEQRIFCDYVNKIEKMKLEFENSLKKLEELQAALMQEYFD